MRGSHSVKVDDLGDYSDWNVWYHNFEPYLGLRPEESEEEHTNKNELSSGVMATNLKFMAPFPLGFKVHEDL